MLIWKILARATTPERKRPFGEPLFLTRFPKRFRTRKASVKSIFKSCLFKQIHRWFGFYIAWSSSLFFFFVLINSFGIFGILRLQEAGLLDVEWGKWYVPSALKCMKVNEINGVPRLSLERQQSGALLRYSLFDQREWRTFTGISMPFRRQSIIGYCQFCETCFVIPSLLYVRNFIS